MFLMNEFGRDGERIAAENVTLMANVVHRQVAKWNVVNLVCTRHIECLAMRDVLNELRKENKPDDLEHSCKITDYYDNRKLFKPLIGSIHYAKKGNKFLPFVLGPTVQWPRRQPHVVKPSCSEEQAQHDVDTRKDITLHSPGVLIDQRCPAGF